uniref:Uncharacterized protein n=1 Tax=Lepeophtheirus salmonis TaxID=72036 RepID=A0A0K2TJU9_LEPSM
MYLCWTAKQHTVAQPRGRLFF